MRNTLSPAARCTFVAEQGSFVFIPRGSRHRFTNIGATDVRALFMFTPGGPAIVATSLLFAAMHIPSHLGSGHLWVALGGMIAFQGFFGLFVGYLWSRYRRFWALVVVHGAVNALSLLPIFMGR